MRRYGLDERVGTFEWVCVSLICLKEARGQGAVRRLVDVELFEDVGSPFCPKRALFNYKKAGAACSLGMEGNLPFFRWHTGANITAADFNRFLREAFADFEGYTEVAGRITSHCFRSAIVTLLGRMQASDDVMQSVGRWTSKAFLRYIKKGRVGRLAHQWEVARIINQHSDKLEAVQIFEGEL